MILVITQFFLSASVVIVAGIFITIFADKIARVTGLGRILVGGLFLAGATSLPELVVDINAIRIGQPGLAVGDLLGSSLFNLLILASLDLFFRLPKRAFSHDSHQHAVSAALAIILTSLVGLGISSKTDVSFLGAGIFPWLIFLIYIFGLQLIFHEQKLEAATERVESKSTTTHLNAKLYPFIGYIISALVILLAAPYLTEAADDIATLSGLGHNFIGTTIVALSTSLPEFVATAAALRIRQPDLALSNILGSNCFNMVLFLPLDFVQDGNLFAHVSILNTVTAFGITMITGLAIMSQLSAVEGKRKIFQPGAELIIISALIVLYLLYLLKTSLI